MEAANTVSLMSESVVRPIHAVLELPVTEHDHAVQCRKTLQGIIVPNLCPAHSCVSVRLALFTAVICPRKTHSVVQSAKRPSRGNEEYHLNDQGAPAERHEQAEIFTKSHPI